MRKREQKIVLENKIQIKAKERIVKKEISPQMDKLKP